MSHQGKVAVITGASRGIGKGLADAFATAGLRLGLCARSCQPVTTRDRLSRPVDVRDLAAVEDFAREVEETLGPIDLWINNAGVLEPIAPVRDVDPSAVAEHLAINVMGVFHGCRTFLRHRRRTSRPGVLINISSGAGRNGYAGWSAYCAGKAAVDRLSECIALEEDHPDLRVHSVAPGVIDTDMQALIRRTPKADFPMLDRFVQMKENDDFSSVDFVAARMLELAFGDDPPEEVLVSFPKGK